MCDLCGWDLYPQPTQDTKHRKYKPNHVCTECKPKQEYPSCANDDCLNLMRPYQSRKEDHPNTVAKGGWGLCTSCYQRKRLYGKP